MKHLNLFFSLLLMAPMVLKAGSYTIADDDLGFSPGQLTIQVGDTVYFDLMMSHDAIQVSDADWLVGDPLPLSGGFSTPFGGGMVVFTEPGEYFYVCTPHAAAGMKGVITVLDNNSDPALARAQIIHNSPSPTVDIWVNGVLLVTEFEYRSATPYVDVPAEVELNIVVAPSPSTSPADGVAAFTATLDEDGTYVIIASGIVGDSVSPFALAVYDMGQEASSLPVTIDILGYHGATDAPVIDLYVRDMGPFVTNVAYNQFTGYNPAIPGNYILDVSVAGDSANIVASFEADLSTLAGEAAVVLASGFVAPDPGQPAFGLFVILPEGDVIELPAYNDPVFARAQIIHNSPSPTVDIWVNGEPFVIDFAFRTATPFVDVHAEVELEIVVAPSPSTSPADGVATFTVSLDENETYVIIANGIVGNADAPFTLDIKTGAQEASTSTDFEFFIMHGSPDAPAVDVVAQGVGPILTNAAYGDISGYIPVPPAAYLLDILPAGSSDVLVTYQADVSGLGGESGVVFASGFLGPDADDPLFGLFLTLEDGTTVPLPLFVGTSNRVLEGNVRLFPNPASDFIDLHVSDALAGTAVISIIDVAGRTVQSETVNHQGEIITRLNIDRLNSGKYYVEIMQAGRSMAVPLIKR